MKRLIKCNLLKLFRIWDKLLISWIIQEGKHLARLSVIIHRQMSRRRVNRISKLVKRVISIILNKLKINCKNKIYKKFKFLNKVWKKRVKPSLQEKYQNTLNLKMLTTTEISWDQRQEAIGSLKKVQWEQV